eukprot:TRINITY_DN103529_c0_g1_i1.p1 TRINITY_DN103529_c0_g1~~TRINITY_DN103529_c0_g1_i1.p1  ORF type:complete len:106 (+),score=22.39 TRINITY_DN103529_c0_g1_i1:54-371(+)
MSSTSSKFVAMLALPKSVCFGDVEDIYFEVEEVEQEFAAQVHKAEQDSETEDTEVLQKVLARIGDQSLRRCSTAGPAKASAEGLSLLLSCSTLLRRRAGSPILSS